MNPAKSLFVRTIIFGAATSTLVVATVVTILVDGFSGQFAVMTIIAVLGIGLTADLGRQWRIARARDTRPGSGPNRNFEDAD